MTKSAGRSAFRRLGAAALLIACAALPVLPPVSATAPPIAATTTAASSPVSPDVDPRAVAALATVLRSGDASRATRADIDLVRSVTGIAPAVEGGRLAHPGGGCSSPVPLPRDFEPACRIHDLGYEVLRAAGTSGAPLPARARRELDRRFGRDLHRACDPVGSPPDRACGMVARIAYLVVRANSLRQRDGVPVDEAWPW